MDILPIGSIFFALLFISATTICRSLAWYAHHNENYEKFRIYNGLSLFFVIVAVVVSILGYSFTSLSTTWRSTFIVLSYLALSLWILQATKQRTGNYYIFGQEPITETEEYLNSDLGAAATVFMLMLLISTFIMWVDMFNTHAESKASQQPQQQIVTIPQ